MKTTQMHKWLVVVTVAGVAASSSMLFAQDSSASNAVPPAVTNGVTPPLAYGVSEVLRLQRAEVGESTIIAFIRNSGNAYALNADQIIYLRQEGVSDAVVSTMLNQPKPGAAIAASSTVTPPPLGAAESGGQVSTATVAPSVTYVQTAPAPAYYYAQPYYDPYYYPAYGWYPPVSFSFGWRGSGWRGGWHR